MAEPQTVLVPAWRLAERETGQQGAWSSNGRLLGSAGVVLAVSSWPCRPGRVVRAERMGDMSAGEQVAREGGRLGQRDQVAAGQHVSLTSEPVPRQRPLELDGEEPVVGSGHDPDRDRRPCAEVAV